MMSTNMLQTIIHDYLVSHPKPGEPPRFHLEVPTHDPDRDNSKFRVSDAGKCRLMRYWKRQGKAASNAMPMEWRVRAEAGNLFHAWIQYMVDEMGCLIDAERQLEDDHRIGHFDMVIETPFGTERYLYDLKTISSKKAYYMAKYGRDADRHHQAQLVSYYMMFPQPEFEKLRLAYVTRDTMEIREFPVIFSEVNALVLEDWDMLIKAWDKRTEPAANPERWECKGCMYADVCDQSLA